MPKQNIHIDLGERSYNIHIGGDLMTRAADVVPVPLSGRSVFIITDDNVEQYAAQVQASFEKAGVSRVDVLSLPAGEQTKSFAQIENVTGWLLENGLNRQSLLVALGGGVIGDLTGFAAAIVMRGVPFIQIPTTLLAQVDSSVGGKTGINTAQGKNLVGAFYQPAAVIIDTDVLGTLPEREMRAGFAEVVKYGFIRDAAFFDWLLQNYEAVLAGEEKALSNAIAVSCKIKADVVQEDEREGGVRALLNLGHTFGHALEAAAGYDGRLLHGEAVSIGILMAFDLSVRLGHCGEKEYAAARDLLEKAGMKTRLLDIVPALDTDIESLLGSMAKDKKVKDGKMHFVLVNTIGDSFVSADVDEALVRDVLNDFLNGKEQ